MDSIHWEERIERFSNGVATACHVTRLSRRIVPQGLTSIRMRSREARPASRARGGTLALDRALAGQPFPKISMACDRCARSAHYDKAALIERVGKDACLPAFALR